MDVIASLEEAVARHNELVDVRDQHQQAATKAETERQQVLGRIELLKELAEEPEPETDEDAVEDEDASKGEPSSD